jgi:CHAT domain-containing protein
MKNYSLEVVKKFGAIDFFTHFLSEVDFVKGIDGGQSGQNYSILPDEVNKNELRSCIESFKMDLIESLKRLSDEEKIYALGKLDDEWSQDLFFKKHFLQLAINNPEVKEKIDLRNKIRDDGSTNLTENDFQIIEKYSFIPIYEQSYLEIRSFIQELRAGKQQQKQQSKQQKQQQKTYQWLINPDKELPELYNRMNGKFIAEIDFPAFRSIFTGQPVQNIATKIQWLADDVLLAYFIDSIRDKITKPKTTDVWSVAKHCFENAESLKQSRGNYQNNKTGLPKHHKLIDDLLKDF